MCGVCVRPLKHLASRRLRQTISSAQRWHQRCLGTARERSPSATRAKAVFSLLLSASLLRASPLVMVNQLPAFGSHVTSLTRMEVAIKDESVDMVAFRRAMAAPAARPEFKGNVVAVQTAPFWSDELGAIEPELGRDDCLDPGNNLFLNLKKGTP